MPAEMNANQVLVDILEDNRRRLKRTFGQIDEECLYWRPDPQGNSIALTLWHMGRLFDLFFTCQALGQPTEEERWFQGGWAERSGYDPRGLGRDGWGTLNGYTQQEVDAMPLFSRELLLDYFDEVLDMVRSFLERTPIETLLATAPGFEGRYTQYQCIQMALLDNTRHLGEIFALKAMWERQHTISGLLRA